MSRGRLATAGASGFGRATNSIHVLASEGGARLSGQILAIDGHTETLAP